MSVSDYKNRYSYRKKNKSIVKFKKDKPEIVTNNGLLITTENKLTGKRKSVFTDDELVIKFDPNYLNLKLTEGSAILDISPVNINSSISISLFSI